MGGLTVPLFLSSLWEVDWRFADGDSRCGSMIYRETMDVSGVEVWTEGWLGRLFLDVERRGQGLSGVRL